MLSDRGKFDPDKKAKARIDFAIASAVVWLTATKKSNQTCLNFSDDKKTGKDCTLAQRTQRTARLNLPENRRLGEAFASLACLAR